MARTSHSYPIRIATVAAAAGRIGISFCPGKHQPNAMTGAWARDLRVDLQAIRDWGASTIVTLVEHHELAELRVAHMSDAVVAEGMRWVHLPIPDVTAPGADFERGWSREGPLLRASLRRGESIFVHCKGGLGRAGTVAARLLVELGEQPTRAIARVREVRPGALEVRSQERHVMRCAAVAD